MRKQTVTFLEEMINDMDRQVERILTVGDIPRDTYSLYLELKYLLSRDIESLNEQIEGE